MDGGDAQSSDQYTVLIVDDNRVALDSMSQMVDLHGLGFGKMAAAGSFRQACTLIDKECSDVLFADIRLTDGTRLELSRCARKRNPQIYVGPVEPQSWRCTAFR